MEAKDYWEYQEMMNNYSKDMIKFYNKEKESVYNSKGYIYVLRDYYGNCKIGCTDKPKKRIIHYVTYNAHPIEIVCLIVVDNKRDAEMWLHNKFDGKRIYEKREWFLLNNEDIDYINSLPTNFYKND